MRVFGDVSGPVYSLTITPLACFLQLPGYHQASRYTLALSQTGRSRCEHGELYLVDGDDLFSNLL